jgi:acyl carrier protein
MARSEDTILAHVREIVANELGLPAADVSPMLGLYAHPRWDSLAHVSILVRLETEFGLTLTERIAEELSTVQQMADRIRGPQ